MKNYSNCASFRAEKAESPASTSDKLELLNLTKEISLSLESSAFSKRETRTYFFLKLIYLGLSLKMHQEGLQIVVDFKGQTVTPEKYSDCFIA